MATFKSAVVCPARLNCSPTGFCILPFLISDLCPFILSRRDCPVWPMYIAEGHCWHMMAYITLVDVQFQPSCSLCTEWKKEILNHHTNRNGEVHWGNCKPWLWPSNSWELAKAYMPRGQMDISGPDKCDAAALLNLFNFCDHFSGIDKKKVRELLSSDWAVYIPGEEDQPDGLEGETEVCMSGSQISEIEMELIKERLKEIYLLVEEQEMLSEENLNRIQMTKDFLKDSGDLQISFQADMQRLECLEKEVYNQRRSMKETGKEYPDQEEDEGCSLKKMKCIPKEQLL
ncbi:uncharacterized protein CXorf38 homolog isoform X3 [Dermochelys coriacea]|uniref:uncharacterized protein CXorf38 homolog isoform X3 n=1 Tax=Dermochelys coriacea TaxID=27794 RepID=UPI001CA9772A|nr:uncharacterized protein CXorf38 homolog isoform X3 [Dermochelys coriacea]